LQRAGRIKAAHFFTMTSSAMAVLFMVRQGYEHEGAEVSTGGTLDLGGSSSVGEGRKRRAGHYVFALAHAILPARSRAGASAAARGTWLRPPQRAGSINASAFITPSAAVVLFMVRRVYEHER
jgi:hypothetical protein